ncbi:MAG: ABC transporter permease [Parvibaculaceae bacterium]
MLTFLLRRLATFAATLAIASVVIFAALELLPGDPAQVMLGIDAPPEVVTALQKKLGVDRPVVERYFSWIAGLAVGDMGESFTYVMPINELIMSRLAVTLPLALFAAVLSIVIGVPIGLYAAAHHKTPRDYGVMVFGQLGIAIPNFWFAILLILVFSVYLGWFPAGGFPGWSAGFWPALKSLFLPALALAIVEAAIFARISRSAVLDVLREDFVRTARAKGLNRRATLIKHVLRNALIPIVTICGLEVSSLLVGTIVIEQVFNIPGLGRLVFQSLTQLDLMVVKNLIMLLVALVVFINLVVDLLYAVIDPRLKQGH